MIILRKQLQFQVTIININNLLVNWITMTRKYGEHLARHSEILDKIFRLYYVSSVVISEPLAHIAQKWCQIN